MLVRSTILVLIVCGFSLTGDAGWIVEQGRKLVNTTTLPAVTTVWGRGSSQGHGPPGDVPMVDVAPSLASPIEPPPADGGPAVVDLRLLRPGARLRLWVAGSPVTFDMVDPAGSEAIQQPATRRVRIRGVTDPSRIERGGSVIVQPRAGIAGLEPPAERIGPVQSLDTR